MPMLTRSKTAGAQAANDEIASVPATTIASPPPQSSPPQPPYVQGSNNSLCSGRSSRSSATIVAQRLAAQAEHARRIADLERSLVEKEQQAAELELQAELAAIDAQSISSSRHSRVNEWVESSTKTVPTFQVTRPNNGTNYDENSYLPSALLPTRVLSSAATHTVKPGSRPTVTKVGVQLAPTPAEPTDIQKLTETIKNLAAPQKQSHRMSDLKLPTFDGRIQDWLVFKRTFDFTKSGFSPLENQSRLNLALKGDARDEVGALLASALDPEMIMSALEARFARPEHIVLHEIAQVKALPRLSSIDGGRDLCRFACRVRRCVETIRVLGQGEYLASPELANIIVNKLSSLLRARWADFAFSRCHTKYRLELLCDFLSHEAEIHSKFGFIPEIKNVDQQKSMGIHTACFDSDEGSSHNNDCYLASMANGAPHVVTPRTSTSLVSGSKRKPIAAPSNMKPPNFLCNFCKNSNVLSSHELADCDKFKLLHYDDRWQWVIENKVCRKCLKKGSHFYRTCKANCAVSNCNRKFSHHTLLHCQLPSERTNYVSLIANSDLPHELSIANDITQARSNATDGVADSSSQQSSASPSLPNDADVVTHTTSQQPKDRPLLKVIPVTVSGSQGTADVYALLDDGSTATIIESSIAELIGATGPKGNIKINCIGGLSRSSTVSFVNFTIKGKHCDKTFDVCNVRAMSDLNISSCQTVLSTDISKFDYLSDLIDVLCYVEAKPSLIIGVDNWHLTVPLAVHHGTKYQPVATLTPLGWCLYGFSSSKSKPVEFINHFISEEGKSIETLIKENYKLDSIGIEKKDYRTKNDRRAIEILENTTRRLPEGRFETGLIWSDGLRDVPNNYELALSRFKSLERKFQKEPEYADAYRQNMQATFDKGYAEVCTEPPKGTVWYLPHFGVFHPQKRKLRIVHDAAAKFLGISFNSMLLSGPDLLQNLVAILMRFREGRVALNADIREMFPQIKVREHDRDAQRFLWRSDPTSPILICRMSSMIFGATCSPFTALYLKNKNALDHSDQYPDAAHAIIDDHYMDDFLGSYDSIIESARLAADIVKVHSLAGFEIRSWVSNEPQSLTSIPPELCSSTSPHVYLGPSSISSNSSSPSCVKILGLSWNIVEDNLYFRTGLPEQLPSPLTKRSALSLLMSVYDPLGFLAPIIVQGRIMFQELWRIGVTWDQSLPSNIVEKWLAWFRKLTKVGTHFIPRWYQGMSLLNKPDLELHVFADASEHAYACVAYWRLSFGTDNIKLCLIGGKARVTPLKPVSMPRLELQAALIAARFASFVIQSHRHKPNKITFWTDSMTVIRWLRSDARTFKPFVAFRVGEIMELSDTTDWRYVPTSDNVADDATRPSSSAFHTSTRWFNGPSFLLEPHHHWPTEPSINVPLPLDEVKQPFHSELMVQINDQPLELPSSVVADHSRFSEWLRLVRSTARVEQFIQLVRHRINFKVQNSVKHERKAVLRTKNFHPLSAELIKAAEKRVLLKSQLDSFPFEFHRPDSKPNINLKNIDVYQDSEHFLRLAGRITRIQDVVEIEPNPIVLDGRNYIVRLLIRHLHKKAAHANIETIVNQLRRRFYVLHLRTSIKTVSKSCLFCRIRKTKALSPLTGDLPYTRLAHHQRPFTNVGLDYFGPVTISVGRRTEKRYVALFTCLTVRAVHLEIVGSLTADSAIMAIKRFIARRGCPAVIMSDNGTAFIGANNKLNEIYDFAANLKIEWKFIPPAAPSMGGAWERLVRSVKTALEVTLQQRSPREETLSTLLLEAEALVNSRPLTHVSVDASDDEALTPFHFLIGSATNEPPLHPLSDSDLVGRLQWKKGLRLADHFWKRWIKEYLPILIPRRSTPPHPRPLNIGDLVLIADGNMPRGSWPRGRVVAIYPGSQGVIRVADIATKAGTLRRPIKKLVPLPTVAT